VKSVASGGAALAWLALAPCLAAQQITLRAGGFHTTYADTITGTAASLGADVSWTGLYTRGTLGASLSQFSQGSRAAQLYGTGVRLLTLDPSRGLGVSGDGILYALNGGVWAARATGGVFGVTTIGPLTAVATASAGGVHRADATGDPLLAGSLRLRAGGHAWSLEGSLEGLHAGAIRYADVGAAVQALRGPASVELVGGVRLGNLGNTNWGQIRAEWQVRPPVSIEASFGRYAPDVTGFLQGTYFSAGLRLALGSAASAIARSLSAGGVMAVRRDGEGAVSVEFTLPDAEGVAIAGEWNAWEPQPLAAAGAGRWRVRLRLPRGVYRFTLVDGTGRWFVPRGVPSQPDDFGGVEGLLVVRS
jgi:hypothetical protein